jgi:hypothetical protein
MDRSKASESDVDRAGVPFYTAVPEEGLIHHAGNTHLRYYLTESVA